jgi:hypothetical protein
MRDSAVTGIISGIIAGLTFQVFVWTFYVLGIADTTPSLLGTYVAVNPGAEVTSFYAQTIGIVIHLTLSTFLGVIAVYMIHLMGNDYLWVKGIAFGAMAYLFIYGAIAKLIVPVQILQPNLATSGVFLIGHLIFGIITVNIAGHYLKEGFRAKQ